ncbi:MAG TPA: M20/M25/M40 family metallo-hydrolase [Terriglobales bacterium]|nr:M20/M25/M40 family metallo-hydrolase [Terriglobales bacterium]
MFLTRELVDIESITGNEAQIGEFLEQRLVQLGYNVSRMPVERHRFNLLALAPGLTAPSVVFSTHMDTVPPFIPSSEDDHKIYGRGSCDAKGIIAAQISAAERLDAEGQPVGLLFLVGEERDSLGAKVANTQPIGSRFLINGEPTDNRLATASKGALRVEVTAHGRMAHSAYPELGESAIDKLIDALHRLRAMPLPSNPEVGPTTLNIGMIEGGRAPNVIPDHAKAHLLYRLVGPSEGLRQRIIEVVGALADVEFTLEIPYVKLRTVGSLPTVAVSFTTDIPALDQWGEPLLLGPGSIHVAHTQHECIEKTQLHASVLIYYAMAKQLMASLSHPQ